MKARISTDLGDPRLLRLLKAEAVEKGIPIKGVLVAALESYFAHRVETKNVQWATESVFDEWNNSQDGLYDDLRKPKKSFW